MLEKLHIQNIGIIQDIEIDFTSGLNVLTGETGAGKSLIINSIGLLIGSRFSKELVRKGENFCNIEAIIDGNVISRNITITGKNVCKFNGNLISLQELKDKMSKVFEIHGQLDNSKILDQQTHITYLDTFSKKELKSFLKNYKDLYVKYLELKAKLKNNFADDLQRQRQLDLLKFQIQEIENAHLKINEDVELEEKRRLFQNAQLISQTLEKTIGNLEQAFSNLNNAKCSLSKISNFKEDYSNLENVVLPMTYDLEEIVIDTKNLFNELDYSDESADEIENRIEKINDLKRKYGISIEDILKYYEKIKKEYYELQNNDEIVEKLKKQESELVEKLQEVANKISKIRSEKLIEFENLVNDTLQLLEMQGAKLKVKHTKLKTFDENGLDNIVFLIKTNKGEDFKDLTKTASGGEMSRIMLAIKSQIAKTDNIETIVFDEIDTGISGNAANAVSKLLVQIGKYIQVLCISHLPNIAAKADSNFYVSKFEENDRTFSKIKKLNEDEILKEIARISSGKITKTSLDYAKELKQVD